MMPSAIYRYVLKRHRLLRRGVDENGIIALKASEMVLHRLTAMAPAGR